MKNLLSFILLLFMGVCLFADGRDVHLKVYYHGDWIDVQGNADGSLNIGIDSVTVNVPAFITNADGTKFLSIGEVSVDYETDSTGILFYGIDSDSNWQVIRFDSLGNLRTVVKNDSATPLYTSNVDYDSASYPKEYITIAGDTLMKYIIKENDKWIDTKTVIYDAEGDIIGLNFDPLVDRVYK